MILRGSLLILFLLSMAPAQAQNVLDGTYVKENYKSPRPKRPPYFHLRFTFDELRDSASRAALTIEGYKIRDRFYEPPLKLDDCIYFNELLDVYFPDKRTGQDPLMKGLSQNSSWFSIATLTGAFRMYCDTSVIDSIIADDNSLISWHTPSDADSLGIKNKSSISVGTPSYKEIRSRINVPFMDYAKPFYLKKQEVANREYMEFIVWVRDSIARTILYNKGLKQFVIIGTDKHGKAIRRLNWKEPVPWEMQREHLEEMYLPEPERFYNRKEFDVTKFLYPLPHTRNDTAFASVKVYPDTLSWVNDFPYSMVEPYTNMYFWHPAFADFPVVGVSYYQALAFLDWKTKREQEKLNAANSKYEVRYELPNQIQWEIAQIVSKENKTIDEKGTGYQIQLDNSWLTDLSLKHKDTIIYDVIPKDKPRRMADEKEWAWISRHRTRSNFFIPLLHPDTRFKGMYDTKRKGSLFKKAEYVYGHGFIAKSEIELKHKFQRENEWLAHNLDVNNVSFLGGNVSEWMKESYTDNWQPVLEKYKQSLKSFKGEDVQLALLLIDYYDKMNDKNGRLVRGSNWYDTRLSYIYGKNQAGMNAKVFLDPSKGRSTVGFRYVVHVRLKEENKTAK